VNGDDDDRLANQIAKLFNRDRGKRLEPFPSIETRPKQACSEGHSVWPPCRATPGVGDPSVRNFSPGHKLSLTNADPRRRLGFSKRDFRGATHKMATPAATSDAATASTQAPPATIHAGGGAARGEGGTGSDDSGEGGRDNGNGSPNGNNSGGDHEGDAPGGNTRRGGAGESKRDGGDDESVSKRGDGEEGDGQDQTAQDAPPANAPGTQALQPGKVATHLTLDEVASHVKQGHLPTCRVAPSGYGNLRPTTRTIPPRHIEDGPSFIVGVPADARTLREGAIV
jgi:hypothetical protein